MEKFNQAHIGSEYFEIAPSLQELVSKALKLSSIQVMNALEVGCGQGLQLSQFDIPKVLGIDISREAISKASKNFPTYSFKCLSSLSLNELEQEFDLILDAHQIHYLQSIDEIQKYLLKVYSVLNWGGLFCMEAMVSHKMMDTNQLEVTVLDYMEYERLLIAQGFKVLYFMIPKGRKIIADKTTRAAFSSDPDVLLVIATKEDVAKAY